VVNLAASIFAVHGGRPPAQAGSRCREDPEEGGHQVYCRRVRTRRISRPQVAYFLSGVLVYFPSGATTGFFSIAVADACEAESLAG
jgi:hypothetical protein